MSYIDHTRRVTVPIRDVASQGAPVFCQVDVYGVSWEDLAAIPGGSAPLRRAVERLGLDPNRYQATVFELGPHCEASSAPRARDGGPPRMVPRVRGGRAIPADVWAP